MGFALKVVPKKTRTGKHIMFQYLGMICVSNIFFTNTFDSSLSGWMCFYI